MEEIFQTSPRSILFVSSRKLSTRPSICYTGQTANQSFQVSKFWYFVIKVAKDFIKKNSKSGIVLCTFSPSTWNVKAKAKGGRSREFKAYWST